MNIPKTSSNLITPSLEQTTPDMTVTGQSSDVIALRIPVTEQNTIDKAMIGQTEIFDSQHLEEYVSPSQRKSVAKGKSPKNSGRDSKPPSQRSNAN